MYNIVSMIRDNILKVRQRIAAAAARAGRNGQEITVIAVTKNRGIEEIREAISAGITDIGENRAQEALEKYNQLVTASRESQMNTACRDRFETCPYITGHIKWHFIGHLQTNKVKVAVKIFDLIQSVDSLRLAQEIDRQAALINKVQDILLEIKTSPEESKSGIKLEQAQQVIADIAGLKNVNIRGLMTIAPAADDPESARPYFRQLRELRDRINVFFTSHVLRPTSYGGLQILSMGMSDDFEVAIEEGATMVRLGRAIFG
ncbi:MAG: YggS family pyridoxal phosphate-dependent enzyme [Candidatus Omnitrophota bacterium]|nr:YggS family pyridoxal phosphate-dependent enzyme [Candidatus Omnitrophota bacterium]